MFIFPIRKKEKKYFVLSEYFILERVKIFFSGSLGGEKEIPKCNTASFLLKNSLFPKLSRSEERESKINI